MPGSAINTHHRPLAYVSRLGLREPDDIDLVVIHCTELPDLETAREYGERIHYERSNTGNSGHFYIDRDGSTESWVDPERVAHHAGRHNHRSIGIELVNTGRWPDWFHSGRQAMTEPYPAEQIDALIKLLNRLDAGFAGLCWITGHESLDRSMIPATDVPTVRVFRKLDPGPLFPWQQVLASTELQLFPAQEE